MKNFRSLHPDLRCLALVGRFLQSWSGLEGNLNGTIQVALGLDVLQAAMLANNMQLRDKINFLRSTISLLTIDPEQTEFIATINRISKYSEWRNTVAHQPFLADDKTDGVRFLVFQAKGKINIPETRWSVDDFRKKLEAIKTANNELKTMQDHIIAGRAPNALLASLYSPTSDSDETDLQDSLSHPSQAHQISDRCPSNPETASQTHSSSEE
jgi:hypothetical protein